MWSAASGIGGLVFGARRPSRSLAETFLVIAVVFPIVCLPLAGASSPLVMAALIALAGLPIAPLISSRNELVGRLAPDGAATESFTWLLTALLAGAAAGSAAGGALAESAELAHRDPRGLRGGRRWERCWRWRCGARCARR